MIQLVLFGLFGLVLLAASVLLWWMWWEIDNVWAKKAKRWGIQPSEIGIRGRDD